jgi:hypothetical protein
MAFLDRVALWLHGQHRRDFTSAEAAHLWQRGFKRRYPALSTDDLLFELRAVDNVVFREVQDRFSLGHLSYQEYLTARGIALGQHLEILVEHMSDPWWRQVAIFYAGFTGDISRLVNTLQKRADLREHKTLLAEMLLEARHTSDFVRTITTEIINER